MWYGSPGRHKQCNRLSRASNRSNDAMIRICDAAGIVIGMQEQRGISRKASLRAGSAGDGVAYETIGQPDLIDAVRL
jgi:hypothetical protein